MGVTTRSVGTIKCYTAKLMVPKPASSLLKPVPLTAAGTVSGTGFSREKPVPLTTARTLSGTGFSREAFEGLLIN